MSGTNENINFEGFSGYEKSLYHTQYDGMNWFDMNELNKSLINILDYKDTGYNNVLHGQGEGFVANEGFMYNYGESFSLKSGTFASAWETNQPVYIYATHTNGIQSEIEVKLSQTATKIDFAKYGSDFTNLYGVSFKVGQGQAGNSVTYGHPTYGDEIAFDNLKVKWSGTIPHDASLGHPHLAQLLEHRAQHFHIAAHLAATGGGDHVAGANHVVGNSAASYSGAGFHSALTSLDSTLQHDSHGGLTDQFTLPQADHFGP